MRPASAPDYTPGYVQRSPPGCRGRRRPHVAQAFRPASAAFSSSTRGPVIILTETVIVMYKEKGDQKRPVGSAPAVGALGAPQSAAARPRALTRSARGAVRGEQGRSRPDRERRGEPVDRDAVQGGGGARRVRGGSGAGLESAAGRSAARGRAASA